VCVRARAHIYVKVAAGVERYQRKQCAENSGGVGRGQRRQAGAPPVNRSTGHRNRIQGRGHGALCAIQHLGVVASQAAPEGESA